MNKSEEELIWESYLLEGQKRDMKIVRKIETGNKKNITWKEIKIYVDFKNQKEGKERFYFDKSTSGMKFKDREIPQHVGALHLDNKGSNVFDPRSIDLIIKMVHGKPPVTTAG